jgi:signal transduction histidine kinase
MQRRHNRKNHDPEATARDGVTPQALQAEEERARLLAAVSTRHILHLQHVTEALATALTAADVARVIVHEGREALGAAAGNLYIRDASDGALILANDTEYPAASLEDFRRVPPGAAVPNADAVRTGTAVWLESQADWEHRYPTVAPLHAATGYEAAASMPLVGRERIEGVLGLSFAGPRAFDAEDRALLLTIGRQAAQALERARLYEAERAARTRAERAADRTARLLAVTAALARATTREEVAETALREGIASVGAVAGGLGILTNDGASIERLAMLGYPEEIVEGTRFLPLDALGPIATTARTGAAVWLGTNEELFSQYPQMASIPARRRFGATVSVPLSVGGQTIGVMSLRFAEERPFDRAARDLIEAIAGQCAQALERARLYEAERTARAEAEEAVRARDQFLSIAAHELKTPVTALKGSAQLLLRRHARGLLDADRLTRTLAILEISADRLAQLTDDLLDVSRIRTGHLPLDPHATDLVALVREAMRRASEQLGARQRLIFEARDPIEPVWADAGRIEQVLTNVLDNAMKYSPGDGTVAVTVRAESEGVVTEVRDNGIGLPPGAAETIFTPFGRAANAVVGSLPGMGLGLYICRNILERHGGWIRAESDGEGCGTTVSFWLPFATNGTHPLHTPDLP